jgi:hypothetical protein
MLLQIAHLRGSQLTISLCKKVKIVLAVSSPSNLRNELSNNL